MATTVLEASMGRGFDNLPPEAMRRIRGRKIGAIFQDRDGAYYIVYGGWRHCNIARLKDDFTGFVPFPDGSTFRIAMPKPVS